jgi:hypothetical protein
VIGGTRVDDEAVLHYCQIANHSYNTLIIIIILRGNLTRVIVLYDDGGHPFHVMHAALGSR